MNFRKFPNLIEEIFRYSLKFLDKCQIQNNQSFKLISVFKETLIDHFKQKDKKFKEIESYLESILGSNKFKEYQKFSETGNLKPFDFKNDPKEKISLEEINNNIIQLNKKMSSCIDSIELVRTILNSNSSELSYMKSELESIKEYSTMDKTKDKKKLSFITNTNLFLSRNFPQFSKKKTLLFELNENNRSAFDKKVQGKKNIIILLNSDNIQLGAFFSKPFPAISSSCIIKDDESCLFEITSNILCKADKNELNHLMIYPGWIYFGNTKNKDGVYTDFESINYGKQTNQFDGINTFGGDGKLKQARLKNLIVYQLNKI